jgi:hypothetical protein
VNADTAGRLGLVGLGRVDDGNVLSTAALRVLDGGTLLGALGSVLALGAVGHVIVELEVAVKLYGNVEVLDGELVDTLVGVAAEGWRLGLVGEARALNDLPTEGSGSKLIPLGELVGAGPAVPVETAIVVELAGDQVAPVEAGLLLVVTLVVGVFWACEWVGAAELICRVSPCSILDGVPRSDLR